MAFEFFKGEEGGSTAPRRNVAGIFGDGEAAPESLVRGEEYAVR